MSLRRGVRTAAVLAAIAVGMTACGAGDGGDDVTGVDLTEDAGGTDAPSTEDDGPSEEAQEPEDGEVGDGEPVFDFPDNFEVILDDDLTGDEEKDELLRDHAYALKALRESYVHQEGTTNFRRYWTDPVDSGYLLEIDEWAEAGWTMAGTDHYYAREVVLLRDGVANIEFCEDTTNGWTEEVSSGEKVEPGQRGEFGAFRKHLYTLEKEGGGDWRVVNTYGEGDSEECAERLR